MHVWGGFWRLVLALSKVRLENLMHLFCGEKQVGGVGLVPGGGCGEGHELIVFSPTLLEDESNYSMLGCEFNSGLKNNL
jgi:hypothetical protein